MLRFIYIIFKPSKHILMSTIEEEITESNDVEESGVQKEVEEEDENGEPNTTCMICMEDWTIGTEHRICCLKCGHLFGRSCIERWIKEKGASNAKCPSCNKPTRKGDLRDLWCKTIKAIDTTELCELQQLLQRERDKRKEDSAIIFHNNLKVDLLQEEVNKLKRSLLERDEKIRRYENMLNRYNKLRAQKLANASSTANGDANMLDQEQLTLLEDSEIEVDTEIHPQEMKGLFNRVSHIDSAAAGCNKSFAICPTSSTILLTQPTPENNRQLFSGFGIRKYQMFDTSIREFIPLHTKVITSMQLKPVGDLILTSGQDKKILLTSLNNNTCILSYQCENEPTCVAWSSHRDQQFYVASGNCYVTLYDIRNTSEHVYQTSQRVAKSRLLSIAPTTSPEDINGLLVNDIKGSQWMEISDSSHYDLETIDRSIEHLNSYNLPFEGLMGTVDFNARHNLALITTRITTYNKNISHNLVRLNKVPTDDGIGRVDCQPVKTFTGGRAENPLLCQSRILRHPTLDDHVLVGACDQGSSSIKLWDTSDGREFQSIRTNAFIRDMLMYTPESSNTHILYALSEKGLSAYKWDYA